MRNFNTFKFKAIEDLWKQSEDEQALKHWINGFNKKII